MVARENYKRYYDKIRKEMFVMNINWDYVVGLIAGATITVVARKVYEQGVEEGERKAFATGKLVKETSNDSVEE